MGGPFSASRNTSHDKRHGSFSSPLLPFSLRSLTSPPTMRNHDDTRNPDDTTAFLPSPSRPNASRRWNFQRFQRCFHRLKPSTLPRILTRAGGGPFSRFNTSATTTTSLASKCESEGRGTFQWFQRHCHRFHLPHIQTRAGGRILTPPPPLEGILPAASTTMGQCETHTPPRSNVFPALRGTWGGV